MRGLLWLRKGEDELTVEYICDGCGAKMPAGRSYDGSPIKPYKWYARTVVVEGVKTEQHACSRACAEKFGGIVAPW